jgi:hypothetical protein
MFHRIAFWNAIGDSHQSPMFASPRPGVKVQNAIQTAM